LKKLKVFNMTRAVNSKKIKIAVLFGGNSPEHEISILTALQTMQAIDCNRYEVIAIYLALDGRWYSGDRLLDRGCYRNFSEYVSELHQVTLLPNPNIQGFLRIDQKGCINTLYPIQVDVCLLAFHGRYGEDGSIQGLLELANIAYTGCRVISSALAMHKYHCKTILRACQIPVLDSKLVRREEAIKDFAKLRQSILQTEGLENFPLFVKPCNLGSSIGVARADNQFELDKALAQAFRYDEEVLIEPCVSSMTEINISILDGLNRRASVIEVPVAQSKTLTYEDKYLKGSKSKKNSSSANGMASLARHINPEFISKDLKNMIKDYALRAFAALGCSGVCRIDFIYDTQKEQIYFNEINPIPGSLAFYLWEKSDPVLLFTEIIDQLIHQALRIKSQSLGVEKQLSFKAL
jgi:D-alanine-D-alanine ligase